MGGGIEGVRLPHRGYIFGCFLSGTSPILRKHPALTIVEDFFVFGIFFPQAEDCHFLTKGRINQDLTVPAGKQATN